MTILRAENYNSFLIRGVQVFDEAVGEFQVVSDIPFSLTVYDPDDNPVAGMTAVTIPAVASKPGDYLKTLIPGNIARASDYRWVLTSTGAYAGRIKIDNENISVVTRAS